MDSLVSEERKLRYDLACIEGRRKRGTPGRTDAEREPEIRARLAELRPQEPRPAQRVEVYDPGRHFNTGD